MIIVIMLSSSSLLPKYFLILLRSHHYHNLFLFLNFLSFAINLSQEQQEFSRIQHSNFSLSSSRSNEGDGNGHVPNEEQSFVRTLSATLNGDSIDGGSPVSMANYSLISANHADIGHVIRDIILMNQFDSNSNNLGTFHQVRSLHPSSSPIPTPTSTTPKQPKAKHIFVPPPSPSIKSRIITSTINNNNKNIRQNRAVNNNNNNNNIGRQQQIINNGRIMEETRTTPRPPLSSSSSQQNSQQQRVREGQIRLVGGQTLFEGNVEINHLGQWGGICDDEWDMAEANVICKQLGFVLGAIEATTNSHYGKSRSKYSQS